MLWSSRSPGDGSSQLAKARLTSKDGVIKYTLSARTYTLHPRQIGEQRGTGHHEKEQNPVPASRPGSCDQEKESSPGGESVWGGGVASNTHADKLHVAPFTFPKMKMK